MVPVGQGLKDIGLSPSKTVFGSSDPSGIGSVSPDPSCAGPASPNLAGRDSASFDPRGSDLL
jgi:hypothetical protein